MKLLKLIELALDAAEEALQYGYDNGYMVMEDKLNVKRLRRIRRRIYKLKLENLDIPKDIEKMEIS